MECRQTTKLVLAAGEVRQMLVEANTMVLVTDGSIAVRAPMLWLAETMVTQESELVPERPRVIEQGGWVALRAISRAEIVLIPPDGIALWSRIGRCLEVFMGGGKEPVTKV